MDLFFYVIPPLMRKSLRSAFQRWVIEQISMPYKGDFRDTQDKNEEMSMV